MKEQEQKPKKKFDYKKFAKNAKSNIKKVKKEGKKIKKELKKAIDDIQNFDISKNLETPDFKTDFDDFNFSTNCTI